MTSEGAMVALQYGATHVDQVTALVLVDGAPNQFSLCGKKELLTTPATLHKLAGQYNPWVACS